MNNKIIRIAAFEIVQDPNNVVKVAGVLSKIKRWILSLFDPQTREQIGVIDSKYSQIKHVIDELQKNIISIEKSIENVDLNGYDSSVSSLIKTLDVLNQVTSKTKEEVEEAQQIREENKTESQKQEAEPKIENKKIESQPSQDQQGIEDLHKEVLEFFKPKSTLSECGVVSSIIYRRPESFYDSIRATYSTNKNILKSFDNDEEKINEFIQGLKNENIIEQNIVPDILNKYKIKSVSKPREKALKSRYQTNICVLSVVGASKITVNNKNYILKLAFELDVFVDDTNNLQEELREGTYKVYKQLVWGIEK